MAPCRSLDLSFLLVTVDWKSGFAFARTLHKKDFCFIYCILSRGEMCRFRRLRYTNSARDLSYEPSLVTGLHEQPDTPSLQDQELAGLQ